MVPKYFIAKIETLGILIFINYKIKFILDQYYN